MKLYVYADESGAFDKVHNDLFVYGGLVLAGAEAKDDAARRYIAIERKIREANSAHDVHPELKASFMTLKERKRAFQSIKKPGCHQFAVIVNQRALRDEVFDSKKRKQRFLDYALKRGIKRGIVQALREDGIPRESIDSVTVVVDEHSTSTCGEYNLMESINEELRNGMFNPTWQLFFPPVFTHGIPEIPVAYVDSSKVPLVRASDITANWVFMAERDRETYPHAIEALEGRCTLLRLP